VRDFVDKIDDIDEKDELAEYTLNNQNTTQIASRDRGFVLRAMFLQPLTQLSPEDNLWPPIF
jgi:hypothetical protein